MRIFALIKGRNSANNSLIDVKAYGGWEELKTFSGDGILRDLRLPAPIYLSRELSVSINGDTQKIGTDFELVDQGATIRFRNAPRPAAKILVRFWTYGAEGYFEDGRDTKTATGGNLVSNLSMLQFNRCGHLQGAQLYSITSSIFDGCSETALLVESTTHSGSLSNIFAGWSPYSLWVRARALGIFSNGLIVNPTPQGYQADGAQGTAVYFENGTSFSGEIFFQAEGAIKKYVRSTAVEQFSKEGHIGFGSCTSLPQYLQWCGNGNLTFNGNNTLSFTNSPAYLYAPGSLWMQALNEIVLNVGTRTIRATSERLILGGMLTFSPTVNVAASPKEGDCGWDFSIHKLKCYDGQSLARSVVMGTRT